jgi:hypothetical protein
MNVVNRKRGPQFTLKWLLVVAPVTAFVGASVVSHIRAIVLLNALGAEWNEDKVFLSGTTVKDDDLHHLQSILFVDVLWMNRTAIGDPGLAKLTQLRRLRALFVDETRVTDAGLVHLEALPLEWLSLNRTGMTDAGIGALVKLRKLTNLELRGTLVTNAGVVELEKSLPDCRIFR